MDVVVAVTRGCSKRGHAFLKLFLFSCHRHASQGCQLFNDHQVLDPRFSILFYSLTTTTTTFPIYLLLGDMTSAIYACVVVAVAHLAQHRKHAVAIRPVLGLRLHWAPIGGNVLHLRRQLQLKALPNILVSAGFIVVIFIIVILIVTSSPLSSFLSSSSIILSSNMSS